MLIRFEDGRWTPDPDPSRPRIIDSFAITAGHVRGWEHHWQRFSTSVLSRGADPGQLAVFRRAATARLCNVAEGFPRLEWAPDRFGLRLRARPWRPVSIRVRWVQGRHARSAPREKGPDLEANARLQALARRHQADAALRVDPAGRALEAAWSNLVWWEDGVLCTLPPEAEVLPGVTQQLVEELARAAGLRVRQAWPDAGRLHGREAWLLSALAGIQHIAAWQGPLQAGAARRLRAFRRALRQRARPLDRLAAGG